VGVVVSLAPRFSEVSRDYRVAKKLWIDRSFACGKNASSTMKREKAIRELKIEGPRRAAVSEKEALKRMKDFSKRKEQFLATARTGKGRSLRP